MKREVLPHFIVLTIPLLVIVLGVITDSGAVGRLSGAAMALATDPFVLIPSLMVGVLRPYKRMLLATFSLLIPLSLILEWFVSDWSGVFSLYTVCIRFVVMVIESHLLNLPVTLIGRKKIADRVDEAPTQS